MGQAACEHGRFELRTDPETGTCLLFIENVNRSGEHWLTLTDIENFGRPIGYVRLVPVSRDSHTFEIAELRPATGPLHPLPDALSDRAGPAPAGSVEHG